MSVVNFTMTFAAQADQVRQVIRAVCIVQDALLIKAYMMYRHVTSSRAACDATYLAGVLVSLSDFLFKAIPAGTIVVFFAWSVLLSISLCLIAAGTRTVALPLRLAGEWCSNIIKGIVTTLKSAGFDYAGSDPSVAVALARAKVSCLSIWDKLFSTVSTELRLAFSRYVGMSMVTDARAEFGVAGGSFKLSAAVNTCMSKQLTAPFKSSVLGQGTGRHGYSPLRVAFPSP